MNQVKNRLQALTLLDRGFAATGDAELAAAVEALDEDHRDALAELTGGDVDVPAIRAAIAKGRLDGTIDGVAVVISDACLADCVEQLGDHADHPSVEQLQGVLPGIVERHGTGITQIMLAATVVGEAPASAIIRDLLKHDDLIKLPPAAPRPLTPLAPAVSVDPEQRAALKAKRKEMRERKQAAARASREQSARAGHRS